MTLGCPVCAGISDQLALELLSSFGWNHCPGWAGIRNLAACSGEDQFPPTSAVLFAEMFANSSMPAAEVLVQRSGFEFLANRIAGLLH